MFPGQIIGFMYDLLIIGAPKPIIGDERVKFITFSSIQTDDNNLRVNKVENVERR